MKTIYHSVIAIILLTSSVIAQNGVSINKGGAAPDNSAELEVVSTEKGILIPRITLANRPLANAVPAGLMIYNTTDKVFNYSNGITWLIFPLAYVKQIQDTDQDTWAGAETNADEDILRFSTGQSGASAEVAQITKDGVNVNYSANSEYLESGRRIAGQNKTAGVTASGNGSYEGIGSASEPATALGANTLSVSPADKEGNTVVGANAGSSVNSIDNTLIGYNAAPALETGTGNAVVGYGAMLVSSAGNANAIIGEAAGAASTADSLILVGANTGGNITSGESNIIIGANLSSPTADSSNYLAIGDKISANLETKQVKFHDAYSFPGTAGGSGELFVLNDNDELEWGGRISQQVAGAMADVKPFDVGIATNQTSISDVHFMKVTSFATAQLLYMATNIKQNNLAASTSATVELGVYDANGVLLSKNDIIVPDGQTGTIQVTLPNGGVEVTSGEVIYVAIYCSSSNLEFPYISSSAAPAKTMSNAGLPANITTPGSSNDNIFVHAY